MAKGNDYRKYDLARLQVEIEEERELKWVSLSLRK